MSSKHAVEVGEHDFQQVVLEGSKEKPVLVDFWAPWCGPCRTLTPTLERLADEYGGAFLLVKVNTDDCPNLGAALQIRSIPAVFLFVDGQPTDGFVGAQGEPAVREFLERHVQPAAQGKDEDPGMSLEDADPEAVKVTLEKRLEDHPNDAAPRLELARMAFADGDEEQVRHHVEALPEDSNEAKAGAPLLAALRFRAECGGDESGWRSKVAEDPDDLDARYALGCCLVSEKRYDEALAELMEIVKRDRHHKEGAAHQAMLTTFALLGPQSDVVRDYRRQLTIYL